MATIYFKGPGRTSRWVPGNCMATSMCIASACVMLEAVLQSLLLPPTSLPSPPPSCIITVSTSKVCGFGRLTSTRPSSMTQAGTTPHRTTHSLAFVNVLKGCHSNIKRRHLSRVFIEIPNQTISSSCTPIIFYSNSQQTRIYLMSKQN